MTVDDAFRALANPTRRRVLDRLHERNGQTLGELCEPLGMTRQSASRHVDVLQAAGLVTTKWRGREKLHYLDSAPIHELGARWMSRYDRQRASALQDLKTGLEDGVGFSYTTYMATSPERLWRGLTDPAFTGRYWGAELHSDWRTGSTVLWKEGPDERPRDLGQTVLEAEPYRHLAYSWHRPRAWNARVLGWSEERLAQARREPRSRVTFDLEPVTEGVRLTVTHDGFREGSVVLDAISGGWPRLLSSLKSLLETGSPLPTAVTSARADP